VLTLLKTIPFKIYKLIVNYKSVSAIKGHQLLQKNNPDFINQVRNRIANKQLIIKRTSIENIIFPNEIDISLSTHQYLLKYYMGRMFTRCLLSCVYSKKKLIYPMPLAWSKIVDNSGIKVSFFWNTILFYISILVFWFFGFFYIFKCIFLNIKRLNFNQGYSYFFDLTKECFPSKDGTDSYDIISWYTKKFNKNKKQLIIHSEPNTIVDRSFNDSWIFYSQDHLPKINYFTIYFKLLPKLIFSFSLLTLINIILLRWWNILFLKEIVSMNLFKHSERRNIADSYLFHYSHQIYRPLWTYVAAARGSDLIFYFYAASISTYREENGEYSTVPEFIQLMNWPKYLVWNEHHSDYLKNLMKYPADLIVVGPIWFQESIFKLPNIAKPSIVAFDNSPYREFFAHTFGNAQQYTYHHKVPINFLKDLQEITSELGIAFYFKRKNNKGQNSAMLNKKYLNFLRKFVKKDNVTEINSGVSPMRLCKEFDLVFSFPFTSTAIIAVSLGKTSVYYDPIGVIQQYDRASHSLAVISRRDELKEFLKNHYKI